MSPHDLRMHINMTPRQTVLAFDGRLPRKALLVWGLPVFALALAVYLGLTQLLINRLGIEQARAEGIAGLVVLVVGAWPFAALLIKRLHDLDLSGWWLLALATPELLNSIGLAAGLSGPKVEPSRLGGLLEYFSFAGGAGLAILALWPGTRGANRFGPDP